MGLHQLRQLQPVPVGTCWPCSRYCADYECHHPTFVRLLWLESHGIGSHRLRRQRYQVYGLAGQVSGLCSRHFSRQPVRGKNVPRWQCLCGPVTGAETGARDSPQHERARRRGHCPFRLQRTGPGRPQHPDTPEQHGGWCS